MSIVYVGLDLGSSSFHQVSMNQAGVIRVNRNFTTSEANLIKAFSDLHGEIHVHLEAGELAPWAAAIIGPLIERVVCSHPRAMPGSPKTATSAIASMLSNSLSYCASIASSKCTTHRTNRGETSRRWYNITTNSPPSKRG